MAKSECKCLHFSCESVLDKVGDGYIIATNRRFRFIKDDNGAICDGGVVPNDIPTCRKTEVHEPLNIKKEIKYRKEILNHAERRKLKRGGTR